MDTIHYQRMFVRYVVLVLLCVIAGGAGGFWVYHNATPLYRSSVQVLVSIANDPAASATAGPQPSAVLRAAALSQIAGTPPAVSDAVQAAGYSNAVPDVTATATGPGPFLTIAVVDEDPARATAVATAFVMTLPGTSVRLEGPTSTPVRLAIISPPTLPITPFSPDPLRNIGFGLTAGLVLGLAIALLRETLNRRVRDSDEVQQLTGLTVMGTVPRKSPKKLLPVVTDPRGARAEGYRQVRTSLINSTTRRPLVVTVTSAAPGEGKTSVVTNVAAALSRAGHRVVLVDADLRRPRVAECFGITPRFGLTDVLAGQTSLEDAVTVLDDGLLGILSAGRIPENPSEALGGVGMEQVLAQLAAQYEYVLIDTPPVLPVTDSLVLAPKVDGVILVVQLGHTTRDRVKQAMAAIARVNGDILGVVPNQAGKGSDSDYGYRYIYKSSSRGGDDSTPPDISAEELQPNERLSREAPPQAERTEQSGNSRSGRLSVGIHRRVAQVSYPDAGAAPTPSVG